MMAVESLPGSRAGRRGHIRMVDMDVGEYTAEEANQPWL